MKTHTSIPFASVTAIACLVCCSVTITIAQKNTRIYDAHGHISLYSQNAIDSLIKYNIYGVRDCGGDLAELTKLKNEINQGKRKGPKLIICGPFLDGPKKTQRSAMTVFITSELQAYRVVDSLSSLRVDFLKTHNGLTRDNYFAILRQAKKRKLKVVSHLPKGVTAWEAAVNGASCIEHVAESILASPIYAGYVKTPKEAANWWLNSVQADSVIKMMARRHTFVTPTLIAFKTLVELPENASIRTELEQGLEDLMKITLKLHRGGVKILAGTDFNSLTKIHPGQSIYEEINLLIKAGLTSREATDAASKNLERWLKK